MRAGGLSDIDPSATANHLHRARLAPTNRESCGVKRGSDSGLRPDIRSHLLRLVTNGNVVQAPRVRPPIRTYTAKLTGRPCLPDLKVTCPR